MKKKRYNKGRYFPNNVREIQNAPDHFFIGLPFDELLDWKVNGYELPDSVFCLMRITDKHTKLVTERYYNTRHYAKKKACSVHTTRLRSSNGIQRWHLPHRAS